MPTLKAEFLSHHYARKLRPRHAYAFGLIDRWSALASRSPALANALTQTPGLSTLAQCRRGRRRSSRRLPKFAPSTFRSLVPELEGGSESGPRVILWPDTFTNHFEPRVGLAAAPCAHRCRLPRHAAPGEALLRAPALRLRLPRPGTPLPASARSTRSERRSAPASRSSGSSRAASRCSATSSPSCFPTTRTHDASRSRPSIWPSSSHSKLRTGRRRSSRGLCSSTVTATRARRTDSRRSERCSSRPGLTVEVPETGCCGMAGAWGYERAHFDVSRACAERVLLPAVRDAAPSTSIVASGFSCRSQIAQLSARRAVHLAALLAGDALAAPGSRVMNRGLIRRENGDHERRGTQSAPGAAS